MIVPLKNLKSLHPSVEEIWQVDPGNPITTLKPSQTVFWNLNFEKFPDDSTGRKLNRSMTVKKGDCTERLLYTVDILYSWTTVQLDNCSDTTIYRQTTEHTADCTNGWLYKWITVQKKHCMYRQITVQASIYTDSRLKRTDDSTGRKLYRLTTVQTDNCFSNTACQKILKYLYGSQRKRHLIKKFTVGKICVFLINVGNGPIIFQPPPPTHTSTN